MNLSPYSYRVTIDQLDTAHPITNSEGGLHSLSFFAENHGDILGIVDRVRTTHGYSAHTAASLAVGLNLFTEVMVRHRHDPLFAPLRQPVQAFLARLRDKQGAIGD